MGVLLENVYANYILLNVYVTQHTNRVLPKYFGDTYLSKMERKIKNNRNLRSIMVGERDVIGDYRLGGRQEGVLASVCVDVETGGDILRQTRKTKRNKKTDHRLSDPEKRLILEGPHLQGEQDHRGGEVTGGEIGGLWEVRFHPTPYSTQVKGVPGEICEVKVFGGLQEDDFTIVVHVSVLVHELVRLQEDTNTRQGGINVGHFNIRPIAGVVGDEDLGDTGGNEVRSRLLPTPGRQGSSGRHVTTTVGPGGVGVGRPRPHSPSVEEGPGEGPQRPFRKRGKEIIFKA